MKSTIPDLVIRGTGSFEPPPLTDVALEAIQERAEQQQDMQLKTDLFRLLIEVRKLREAKHA